MWRTRLLRWRPDTGPTWHRWGRRWRLWHFWGPGYELGFSNCAKPLWLLLGLAPRLADFSRPRFPSVGVLSCGLFSQPEMGSSHGAEFLIWLCVAMQLSLLFLLLSQPLMREALEKTPSLSQQAARALIERCMRILYYRDARSFNRVRGGGWHLPLKVEILRPPEDPNPLSSLLSTRSPPSPRKAWRWKDP